MPLYNQTGHLIEALESIIRQSHDDFRLIIVDDSTSDEPGRIAARYAEQDERITYIRNETRLGMVDNWRRAFELAGPEAEFFAWVSDHDRWDECWLEDMLDGLKSDPQAMLCYPRAVRINEAGQVQESKKTLQFETTGLNRWDRSKAVCRQINGMGTMVYGLFRARGLRQAGVFRRTLLPDLILMVELSLYGTIKQVPKDLWYRRYLSSFSLDRQRTSLFQKLPMHARLPVPLVWVHTAMLFWLHVAGPRAGELRHRARGLFLCGQFFFWFTIGRSRRWLKDRRKAVQRTWVYQTIKTNVKRLRRAPKKVLLHARNVLARVGVLSQQFADQGAPDSTSPGL
jgi:glycosyltransferase involved in cell wall biosynthesis